MTATATDRAGDATGIADILLDPFDYIPNLHSVIHGLHGEDPTDLTYAFHTHYIDGLTGTVTMEVTFTDLRSRKDRLFLTVHALDPVSGTLEAVASADMALRTVAATGGQASIRFDPRPDRAYALLGRTNPEPSISATALAIRCVQRPRALPVQEDGPAKADTGFHPAAVRPVAALAGLYRPLLASPMAQARTDSQFREPAFRAWSGLAGFKGLAADEQWNRAYLLQVLKIFGVLDRRAHGLGVGAITPELLGMLEETGCTADVAPAPSHRGPDDHSHDEKDSYFSWIGLPDPALLGHYDFLWSTGLCGILPSTEDIIHLAEDSVAYLKPGGLAVHLLMADLRADETGLVPGPVFTRNGLGRFSLAMVAGKNEVAQLNLHTDRHDGRPVPYGVIVRKG